MENPNLLHARFLPEVKRLPFIPFRYLKNRRRILTCVIGAKCADGCAIVADTRMMREFESVNESKFHILWDKVAIAGAGTTTMIDNFADEMKESEIPTSSQSARNIVKKIEDIVYGLHQRYAERFGSEDSRLFDALVMGLENFNSGDPYLKLIHSEGVAEDVPKFAIIGHGAPYVAELFSLLYDPMLTVQEVAILGYFCIASIVFLGLDQTVGMSQLGPECVILKANSEPTFLNPLGTDFNNCKSSLNNLNFRLKLVPQIWQKIPMAYENMIIGKEVIEPNLEALKAQYEAQQKMSKLLTSFDVWACSAGCQDSVKHPIQMWTRARDSTERPPPKFCSFCGKPMIRKMGRIKLGFSEKEGKGEQNSGKNE